MFIIIFIIFILFSICIEFRAFLVAVLFLHRFSVGEKIKVAAQNDTLEELEHSNVSPPVTSSGEPKDSPEDFKEFEALPERPIQLVRPDPAHHKLLEVIPQNVRHLHYITSSVAVVAVVGKYHSGKSFLLNQLMGKWEKGSGSGFGIGPTVRPQTMGIWMWGKVNFSGCMSCMKKCTG